MQRGRGAYLTCLLVVFKTLSGVPGRIMRGAEHLVKKFGSRQRGLLFSNQVMFSANSETRDIEMRLAST